MKKIVRCLRGAIFDVALDLRADSPTFLQYFGIELSEQNSKYLFIPKGFAHGFQALCDNVEIIYTQSEFFAPDIDKGLNPLDPALNIKWKLKPTNMSLKDKNAPFIDGNFRGLKV